MLRVFSQEEPCVYKMITIRIVSHVFVHIMPIIFYCELPMYFYMFGCLGPFCNVALLVPVVMDEIEIVLDSMKVSDLYRQFCIIVSGEACQD